MQSSIYKISAWWGIEIKSYLLRTFYATTEKEKYIFSLTLLSSQLGSHNKSQINKAYTLFNINFTWHGSLHKEMKTQMVKPKCVYAGFGKDKKVMEMLPGQKEGISWA